MPALSFFVWANGAPFEEVINGYTSSNFPSGIDPRSSEVLQILGKFNGSAGLDNSSSNESYSAYPSNVDGRNSSQNRLKYTAAPVDSS